MSGKVEQETTTKFENDDVSTENDDVSTENDDVSTSETEQDETSTTESETSSDKQTLSESADSEDNSDEEDEVVVTIGEAPAPEQKVNTAPLWVKELRKTARETQKENKKLRQELDQLRKPKEESVTPLGKKPRLVDYDYDSDRYETELDKWYDRKRDLETKQSKAKADADAQQNAWNQQLEQHENKKSQLKVKDYDDAETVATSLLNETQQGIIIHGADNSALILYALGKNPEKAKELSKITDPVKFTFAISKLEKDLKVTTRKPPPPEKQVSSSGTSTDGGDAQLNRLRDEAAKTGNYTKVVAYKKQQKQRAQTR